MLEEKLCVGREIFLFPAECFYSLPFFGHYLATTFCHKQKSHSGSFPSGLNSLIFIWWSQRDLNPCLWRERPVS